MQSRWILTATILASSMAFIDGTVVNVALPFLQKELNATVIGVQWIVESYSLFLSALLLVGGSLGDRYGRRRIFSIGVIIFAIASGACGFAANIEQLIIARAVQGVGGALLVPGSLAIISAAFDQDHRGKAIGTWSGFSAITTAIGPVLGGWLVEHISWRAVFFINLPLAFAVVIISFFKVPESKDDEDLGPLDWLGACAATLGLGGLVYGLIESSRWGFSKPIVILTLLGGVAALLFFLWNEAHAQNPMVPLHLFRSRNFSGANLLTLLLYAAIGALFFFLSLNFVQVQKYSATAAGAALLPFIVFMFVLSRWAGGLVDRFGARLPLVIGPFIAAAGFVLFALPGVGASYLFGFLPAILVLGIGMTATVAPLTTTVMNSVSQEQAGVASGINNAVSRTAGLLAIAVFGVVMLVSFSNALQRQLSELGIDERLRSSLMDQRVKLAGIEIPAALNAGDKDKVQTAIDRSFIAGFRVLMLISAALAAASGLISWILIRSDSRATS
ncbi:MAG TPA: MFS transporter [Pyrinomonadaceae bacterium]|nr:MFS transporter [Pyrinomonadaceae bacterium]